MVLNGMIIIGIIKSVKRKKVIMMGRADKDKGRHIDVMFIYVEFNNAVCSAGFTANGW
jgi:hypothetical protein